MSSKVNELCTALEKELKPLIKKASLMKFIECEIPEDSHFKSHIGGQPYFEKGVEWPTTSDGTEIQFFLQIFNGDGIMLPEDVSLIQFFYNNDGMCVSSEDEGWFVKIYKTLNKDDFVFVEKLGEDAIIDYCQIDFEVETMPSLPTLEQLEEDSPEEVQEILEKVEDLGMDIDDFFDKHFLPFVFSKLDFTGHSKVGGYADWVDTDYGRAYDKYELLFQISDNNEYIRSANVWHGLLYLLRNTETGDLFFEMAH